MFPPFTGTTYCRIRTPLAPLIVMSRIVMLMFALYLLFLPPFLSGRPRDDADAPVVDYITEDPSSCATELPGKPPLITRYRLFLLSTACIRVV